jgi:hypothetical protein
MVDGASLLPVNISRPPWAPAELPSVKQPGSWCAEVDEDGVASCRGVVADLKVIGVDDGNLAFNNNGAIGAGVEEPAPSVIGVEIPIPSREEGLWSC